MIRLILLTTCIFALSNAVTASDTEEIKVKLQVLNDIESFLSENPNVELIPLEKKLSVKEGNRVQLQYTFGERKPGDRLIGVASRRWTYPAPQNVRIGLQYSGSIVGPSITYLVIDVEQSTSLGKAYISSGGIGQRTIAVIVEAQSTTYFSFNANLYGIN